MNFVARNSLMSVEVRTKAVVSVAEMARMCGLSRARFYQLVQTGVFPPPLYSIETRRPLFTEEMQEVCLEVRRRNCGINGRPVMFYARRFGSSAIPKPKRTPTAKPQQHTELIDGLKALGLVTVTAAQVEAALSKCFSSGTGSLDEATVLRTVFLHLKRRDSDDNLGR